MFMGFTLHVYIIFGTHLLTEGPTRIAIFLPISVFRRKWISNGVQTEWNFREDFSWTRRHPQDLECMSGKPRGTTRTEGTPRGSGAPPLLWAPCDSTDLVSSPIYSDISHKQQREPRKHFSTATTFCTHDIPSRGLFRRPVGGGFYHRGLLHQHHYLSDEVWAVHRRPSGP